jgi:hypothetical protein
LLQVEDYSGRRYDPLVIARKNKHLAWIAPLIAAAVAWVSLEGLRHVSDALALGVGALFLLIAIPVLLRRRGE